MTSDHPSSKQKPDVEYIADNKPTVETTPPPIATKPSSEQSANVRTDILSIVDDELIRIRIRELADKKPASSIWKQVPTHPLTLIGVGFLLTGIVGGLLTNRYTSKQSELESERNFKQRELERERSFTDELNKTRIAKIGEVWEKLNLYEEANNEAIAKLSYERRVMDKKLADYIASNPKRAYPVPMSVRRKFFDEYDKQYLKIIKPAEAHREALSEVLHKNRFWLGEKEFSEIRKYIEITTQYISISREEAEDSRERARKLFEEKEKLRKDIEKIREGWTMTN